MKQNFLLRIGSVITPPYLRGSKIAHRASTSPFRGLGGFTRASLILLVMLMSVNMAWGATTKTLIIDGSKLTSTATTSNVDYTYGDFTITISDGAKSQSSSGSNKFTNNAILIGKSGKYIYNKTPFNKITKFEIYANKGASTKVSVGVVFSTTAISAYATGTNTYTATLSTLDNVYDCSSKIPEGAKYFWYQVTNANNSQVEFRITYEEAASSSPSLTPSAPSLAFCSVESGSSKSLSTLTVAGANLTNDISFEITGTNASYFTVTNPSSISKGTGTVSATAITIKYAPETTGNHTATLQIKSTGADTKEVTLTGRGSSAGEIFFESFDENDGTGGNDNQWSGSIASNDLTADNEGWTFTKGSGANKCAKFGTGSALGSAETPELSYTGSATLTFKAAAWNGNSESTTLKLSATNATLSESSVTLTKGAWDNFEITVTDIKEGAKIKFEGNAASNSRFFLDEVLLVAVPTAKTVSVEVAEGQSAMGTATINGGTDPVEIAGEGEEEFTFAASPKDGYLFSYWSSTGDIEFNGEMTSNPIVGGLATETSVVTAHFVKKSSMSATPTKIEKSAYVGEDDCYGEVVINFQGSDIVLHSSVTFLIDPVTSFANDDAEFELDAYSQFMNYTDLNKNVTLTYAGYTEGTYKVNVVATAYDLKSNETGSVTVPVTLTIANRTQAHVTFDANGKTLTGDLPAAVDYDLTEQTLPEVAAIGYTFKGWNTNKDATEGSLKFTPPAAQPYTLYAIWSANLYDVIFNKNNEAATGEMANLTINYKESADLTANNYELTGHTFQGWATTSDGAVAYADKANYTMNTADDVNLYAVWKADSYTITYMDGDKEYAPTTGMPTTHTYGTDTPLEDGSKVGYTFVGWYKESTLDNKVTSLGATDYTDNITLYAKWEMIVPTSWSFDKTELTLVWNDNNNKIGYVTPTIEPANAYNKVSYSKIGNEDVVSIYNDNNALKVTAIKEGTATYLAKADGNSELKQVITITVKSLPKITWLNADGSTFATTDATALVDGTVGALPTVDADHQPVTCDAVGGYTTFKGWSKHAFRAQGDAPTDYVQTTDPVGESGATFYAVFAKVEGEDKDPEFQKYEAVKTAPEDWSGTYLMIVNDKIVELNGNATASMKAATSFNATTEVVGKEVVVAKTTNGYSIFLKEKNQYLGKGSGNTSLDMKTTYAANSFDWTLSTSSIQSVSVTTRYIMLNGDNVGTYVPSSSYNYVTLYRRVETAGSHAEIKGYLSSCCTGYDVTLTNEGTATGGTFAANPTTACKGDVVTLTASKETGYSFSSWSVEGATPESATAETTTITMPAFNVTVNATFTPNKHNVVFTKNDGSASVYTQEFSYGETKKLTKNSFEREGYKFNGWATTDAGTVEYTDEASFILNQDNDVQLYAVWTADDAVAVSVQGTEHLSDITAPTSISAKAKSLSFTYSVATGYKVVGVTVTIDGTPIAEGFSFTQTTFSLLSDADFAGAIVITFDVEEILYTVTLNPGSGTCESASLTQTSYGAAVTLPVATTIADGWTFAGWAAAAVETETETAPTLYTGTYTPVEDLTLFAVYKRGEEIIGETYTCDFEEATNPTNWKFSNFAGQKTNSKMPAVSGDYFGATTISSQSGGTGYVLLNKQITGKYRITASVGSTSDSDKNGTFEVKVSGTSWTTVGSSVSVAGSSNQYKWKTLTWTGDLNNQNIEVFYTGGSNATRVIDNVVVEEIATKSYYHSTPSVVTDLKVTKAPAANIKYKEGETFNPAGIELTATYDNDKTKTETVTSEMFTCDFSGAVLYGETIVTFTYKGATCTQKITAMRLTEIKIETAPSDLEYVEGEKFDNTNLKVRASYAYETTTTSELIAKDKLTYSPSLTTPLTTSNDKVTISYTWAGETKSVDQAITVVGKVKTPVIAPNGGEITTPTEVTLSCETESATIYYTTDESDPTTSATKQTYEGLFTVQPGQTVRAYAVREGWGDSEVAWATFSEKPVFDQGDWILVTDASELTAGSYVIIANADYNVAMKSYVSGEYCAEVSATFSQDGSMLTYKSGFGVFELREYKVENEVKGMSFYDYNKKQYLYYSGSNNTLKAQNNQDATAAWTFSQDEFGMYVYNYTSTSRKIQDNHSSTRFACYTSTQGEIQLYKYYKKVPKLIYDANGGENAPVPTRAENGIAVVTNQQPTWGGHEFVKWTENQDGSGKVYTATEEVPLTADLTIYAQWQEKQLEGTPVALVVKYNDKFYAMGKDLSAVEVLGIINGKVAVENTVDQKSITWYRNDVEDGVIFQNCEEKYLYAKGGGADLSVEAEGSTWVWNENGYYVANGENRTFIYREDYGFRNYGTSNIGTSGYSSAATCYEGFLVGSEIISRATAPGKIGTICMEKDIVATEGGVIYMPDYKDATIKNVYFVEATTELATPGMPFIFVGEADNMLVLLGYEEVENPVDDLDQTRGMVGSFGEIDVPMYTLENPYYCFQNNKLYKVGADTKSQGHRAYMNMASVPYQEGAVQDEPSAAPRRRLSMVNADADQGGVITGLGDVLNANNVQKLIINDKMYILRAGKMYDATGKFVK